MSDKGAIYEAIPAILADVDAIGKTRKNTQQGYSFRGIDDVYNAIHPLLASHKVFPTCEIVSRDVTERETKNGGVLFYVNIKARYTLWAHDGSSVTTEAWGEAMDSGDKASNKAMSAAYKYALFQLLCIPTEAVDSEQDHHEDIKPRAKKIAAEHGMTTADELPEKKPAKPKAMTFDQLKAALDGIPPDDPNFSARITKAEDVIYAQAKAGHIDEKQRLDLAFAMAEIQRAHDALSQPAAA